MSALLEAVLGRLPLGWLQLVHRKGRFAAAIAGVAFANLLVFFQLGFLGALGTSVTLPYGAIEAQIMLSPADARTLSAGATLPRALVFEALAVPGVAAAAPLHVGTLPVSGFAPADLALTVFGVDPDALARHFTPAIAAAAPLLRVADTVVVDRETRFLSPAILERIEQGPPLPFETLDRTLAAAGTVAIGAGFEADGHALVSDETFLRLFPNRSARAPNHVLVRLEPWADTERVLAALRDVASARYAVARTVSEAAAAERSFQTVERPVGMIFGFGAFMGVLVGLVIVYQVLSTEISDYLREFATLKAVGWPPRFFVGIVLEEAVILAVLGFVPGFVVASLIYDALAGATGLALAMTTERAGAILLGTVCACVVSGLLATRRLAAADPADLF